MFELTVQDLVKGLRSHAHNEQAFVSDALRDIKTELVSSDVVIKTQALEKLVYLQMLGIDISWASFFIVEVMNLPWFGHKRIGYLAAQQSFTKHTEVSLLTVHFFKTVLTKVPSPALFGISSASSGWMYEKGSALACLARISNPTLAESLLYDVVSCFSSSQPFVVKKAILCTYRLLEDFPIALRDVYERLKERINHEDMSVSVAAVQVFCELARKNPKNYPPLVPLLYHILTTSTNNWILIKVVKTFGLLIPAEPRIPEKLLPSLLNLVRTTNAKSLMFECIQTIICGLPFIASKDISQPAVELCVDKLRELLNDPDPNRILFFLWKLT
jgi:AP-3 complex subunit delta-1